jgi:heptosyltransferase III
MKEKHGAIFHLRLASRGSRYARQVLYAFIKLLIQCVFYRKFILLIRRHAAIGDIVCTLPSVGTLRQNYPKSFIVYETGYSNMALVRRSRDVDLVVEGGSWLAKLLPKVVKQEMLFHLLLPDEHRPPRPVERIHLVEEFKRGFGLKSLIEQPVLLDVSARALRQVRLRLKRERLCEKPFVVIHTGPTWKVREWPESNWCRLVAEFKTQKHLEVIQIGQDQTSFGETRKAPRAAGARNWVGTLTIDQTLALLSLADLFVGIDSGVLHLAGALNTPCVGIFGPTDPACRLPKNPRATSVTLHIPCLGCHHDVQGPRHWQSGCPHDIRCMLELTTGEVLAACDKHLHN